ncbi:hypothetical protein KF728_05590 [Candidatus Obscuribacterales bacterium]|nr:hypothetical protein [Candidatus Obscuribacterales bacterium]
MNVTSNHLAAGEKSNPAELARALFEGHRDEVLKSGHNLSSESREQDFTTESYKSSQAQAGYWKHRKQVRDALSRQSYTGLPSVDPVHFQALSQLVENYSEALQETATFNRAKAQRAAQRRAVQTGSKPELNDEEIFAMIVGTGDAMDASALKRRQLLIAESPNATPEILAELALSNFADVKEAVAEHPLCPVSILVNLADDESLDVRYALAENHNMPFIVLEKLSNDDNPFIAIRAERTMRRVLFDNVVCLAVPESEDEGNISATG